VRVSGSIFDAGFAARLERAQFLRSLSGRITQPIMPDDEPFEYLATQAIADFLATESVVPIDGIIFPSVQIAGGGLNVVLFHKAARVDAMEIPVGTKITARTGQFGEDGWEDDYLVMEEVPPTPREEDQKQKDPEWPDWAAMAAIPCRPVDSDSCKASLRILPDSIKVHRVRRVLFETEEYPVQRHRWEKIKNEF
jgi:hypothetical protein